MNTITIANANSLLALAQRPLATATAGDTAPAAPAADRFQPTGFAAGVDTAANQLCGLTGRLTGAIGTLSLGGLAATAVAKATVAAPVVLTGAAGTFGFAAAIAVGGALAYAGWKAGAWAANKSIAAFDRFGESVGQSTGSQAAATVARVTPKLILGMFAPAISSITTGGVSLNMALPAAAYVAGAGAASALQARKG